MSGGMIAAERVERVGPYRLMVRFPGTPEECAVLLGLLRCFSALISAQPAQETRAQEQPAATGTADLEICCSEEGLAETLAVLLQAGCVDFRKTP